MPINFDSGKRRLKKRDTNQIKYNSIENYHVIHKRSNDLNQIDDFSFNKSNSNFLVSSY